MTLYSAVLFLHIVCVLGLAIALSFEWFTMWRLWAVRNTAEVHTGITTVPQLPIIAIGSMSVLLISGIYLTVQLQVWALAWPKVSLVGLLLLAPFGAISWRKTRAIRANVSAGTDMQIERLRRRVSDPFLALSLGIRTAVVLGIILIMTAKPTLSVSLGILSIALIAGVVLSLPLRGRSITAVSAHQS